MAYSYFRAIFILEELPKKPLGAVIEGLEGGKNLVAKSQKIYSKYRVLKISAVTKENFSSSETKPLPTDYVPPSGHLVKNGDLLISRANTTEMVGSVAFARGVGENIALPDKIWKFIWKKTTEVLPEYIYFLLQTPEYRLKIQQLSSGSSGSMKNISKSKLLKLDIPVPDFKQQLHFADLFQRLS
ncbi:restriction endonuclease subunit S [Rothia sp. 88186D007BW]